MNGQWLGSRSIRTNWATRKPPATKAEREYTNNFDFSFIQTHFTDILTFWDICRPMHFFSIASSPPFLWDTLRKLKMLKYGKYPFIQFCYEISLKEIPIKMRNTVSPQPNMVRFRQYKTRNKFIYYNFLVDQQFRCSTLDVVLWFRS